jgi:lipid A 3-O-deacylase
MGIGMRLTIRHLLLTLVLSSAAASTAAADRRDALTLGLGAHDVPGLEYLSAEASLTYRFAPRLFADHFGPMFHGIGPQVGLKANTDGGVYGHGGVFLDIRPTDNIVIWPAAGAGGYSQGNSIDLGGVFQFYLEIFGGYRFAPGHMLGISFQHVSNASIHKHNPGVNSYFLTYTVELPALF